MSGSLGMPDPRDMSGIPGAPAPIMVAPGGPGEAEADLPPLETEDFLPSVGRWATWGGYVMAGTLCGAIALAALLKYNVTVQTNASVRPAGELNVLQSAVDGTVSAVKVQPNQEVRQGDVIVEIAAFDRNRLRVLQAKQNTQEGYLRQYKAKLASINSQIQAVNREILAKGGVAPIPSSVTQGGDGKQPDPDTLVASTLEKMGKSGEKLAARRDALVQQRIALQNQIQIDEGTLEEVKAELNKQIVRAPTDGKLLKLDVNNPGQPLRVGDSIAQIVPNNAPLVVKGQVETQDIGKVAVGQPVQIRVSAYPYPDYGVLQGKVQAIAPDVTTIREGNNAGLSYYEVTIQPDQSYLTKGDRQYPLQSGMDVRADIVSRQETLLQLLLRKARLMTDL